MRDRALFFWQDLRDHWRPADALDIALVAVLVYFCLVWLRTRASRAVLVTLALVAAVYAVSRALDLYLALTLFHEIGPTVILVGLVLVFQDDLRRAFERLAAWGWRRARPRAEAHGGTIDTLLDSLRGLAREHIGALVVVKSRESLERHVRGGVPLDGAISGPLLRSIFDPHSPGHDGAVVIDDDRITRFAVHLPLSENREALGGGGTRHAAALGLAERADPVVLVVSEETGAISVARHGAIQAVESAADLKRQLDDFYEELHPPHGPQHWWRGLIRHPLLKLTSLCLAGLLWWIFAYRVAAVQRTYDVPIEYRNVPENWTLEDAPASAGVTLSGREREFNLLNAERLAFSLDLEMAEFDEGIQGAHRIPLTEESLQNVPRGLEVTEIEPRAIWIRARRRSTAPEGEPSGPQSAMQ